MMSILRAHAPLPTRSLLISTIHGRICACGHLILVWAAKWNFLVVAHAAHHVAHRVKARVIHAGKAVSVAYQINGVFGLKVAYLLISCAAV